MVLMKLGRWDPVWQLIPKGEKNVSSKKRTLNPRILFVTLNTQKKEKKRIRNEFKTPINTTLSIAWVLNTRLLETQEDHKRSEPSAEVENF